MGHGNHGGFTSIQVKHKGKILRIECVKGKLVMLRNVFQYGSCGVRGESLMSSGTWTNRTKLHSKTV